MMAQYQALKAQAEDCLLFYRMGDFFELFFDDARKAAGVLDIALTSRGEHDGVPVPMCGVPVHAAESYLARLIRAAFALLGLQTYFTAGPKEVRAWTVPVGATAPQAAGVIHTDFERGFIRAQTIAFDDFIACGGEHGAREAGRMRAEGKEYVVKDGDVLNFLFNV